MGQPLLFDPGPLPDSSDWVVWSKTLRPHYIAGEALKASRRHKYKCLCYLWFVGVGWSKELVTRDEDNYLTEEQISACVMAGNVLRASDCTTEFLNKLAGG